MSYRWPVAECLHEHATTQNHIVNFAGELRRIIPAHCPECGHQFPPDPALFEAP